MRALHFTWAGERREFIPTMAVLSAMASDICRTSEGLENTVSLASKMLGGGADPVFASVGLWHLLRASGATVTREDAYAQMLSAEVTLAEKAEFRQAFIASVLPSVDLGKKPEAPAVTALAPQKARRKK